MTMKPKATKLIISAWPQLIEALERHPVLGTTPEDVAKFLIIEGLESRDRERLAANRARNGAIASGWRGNL